MQRTVEKGEIEQEVYSSKELLEEFSWYKISFVIFQSKKTARKHKEGWTIYSKKLWMPKDHK